MSGVPFVPSSPPEQSWVHNIVHPLPWNKVFLRTKCEEINQNIGHRTIGYSHLLRKIQETESSDHLRENFKLILQSIPQELLKKYQIRQLMEKLFLRFYLEEVRNLEDEEQILNRDQEISEIAHLCPAEFEGVIERCKNFCLDKGFLISFEKSSRRKYRVLSIDGGGIRGIIPAMVLVEIERLTGEPISNLFDLIGGTSTGGILSLGLAKEGEAIRAQDLLNLYTEQHGRIFRPNPQYQAVDTSDFRGIDRVVHELFNPKYLAPDEFFEEKFRNASLANCKTDILVTTNSQDAVKSKATSVVMSGLSFVGTIFTGEKFIWSHDSMARKVHYFTKEGLKQLSYRMIDVNKHEYHSSPPQNSTFKLESKENLPLREIAKFTSAAPFYFPPIPFMNTYFADGGILQNDPALPCVLESKNKGYSKKDIFLVSLGTGEVRNEKLSSDFKSNFVSMWFKTIQDKFEKFDALLSQLDPGGYHRLQYHFDGSAPELDDTSPKTIAFLKECGRKLIRQNRDLLQEICKVLVSKK